MIKFAVVGYGNLGKACEEIAVNSSEFEMVGIFTRRDPATMSSKFNSSFYCQDEIENFAGKIDVVALCTGSANDLTDLGEKLAKTFNTVDSFDTHAKMREYSIKMQKIASENGKLCFIGIGWDPGLFSLMRAFFDGVLDTGSTQTFWGKGVSQGHSEAVRKIDGVKTAIQYTIPKNEALELARKGKGANLTTRDKHLRECFVVLKPDADKSSIESQIVNMPNYFADYDTVVNFISEQEFDKNHRSMPHGGFVMRSGEVNGSRESLEFKLNLDSNPDFTASVLMSYARANAKLAKEGMIGAKTVLDIPASALLKLSSLDMIDKYV